jgi:hypothetical protein
MVPYLDQMETQVAQAVLWIGCGLNERGVQIRIATGTEIEIIFIVLRDHSPPLQYWG